MLVTLDYTIRMGSTPTILYFDLYLYSGNAGHYLYFNFVLKVHEGPLRRNLNNKRGLGLGVLKV